MTESDEAGVDYVLASHPLRRLTTPILLRARRAMYERFVRTCAPDPSESILDVGVTPDTTLSDSNYLERWYPHRDRITATSIEDASALERHYPGVRFVRSPGSHLPFEDDEFDICFSSAVLEHVGARQQQAHFVAEMSRVARRVFLTTPNRWFPVELHTYLPLVHWLPQPTHQRILRRVGHEQWAATENLNLVSRRQLRELFPSAAAVSITAHRTLGLPSNLIAYSTRRT